MSAILSRLLNEWPRAQMLIGLGLRWWCNELAWLVGPLPRRFGRRSDAVFLVADADGELSVPSRYQHATYEREDWTTLCPGRQTFVSLDATQIMCLPITLPRTALANLKETVKYKLITDSPLPVEDIYYDARYQPRGRRGGKQKDIVIDVAICRRANVEACGNKLEDAGVPASVIGFSPECRPPLDFVFLTSRGARRVHATVKTHRWLAISAFLICFGIFPATYVGARWLTAQTLSEIARIRESQEGLMPLYEQRAGIRAAQHALAGHLGPPRLSNVLDDLAAHLPHTDWLHIVRYENGTLRINGYAPVPAATARSLENASLLSRVKLDTVTGTVKGQEAAQVQFELSAAVQRSDPGE